MPACPGVAGEMEEGLHFCPAPLFPRTVAVPQDVGGCCLWQSTSVRNVAGKPGVSAGEVEVGGLGGWAWGFGAMEARKSSCSEASPQHMGQGGGARVLSSPTQITP